jgi:hypothetical protein
MVPAMAFPIVTCVIAALILLVAAWVWRAARRLRVHRPVVRDRARIIAGHEPVCRPRQDTAALAETFARDSLIRADQLLDDASLSKLRQEVSDNIPRLVRSYIPTHKQGGTLSYEALHHHAPTCLAFYHSPTFLRWVSDVVGVSVKPAGDHDQSACSILYYTQEGDYINWHYDYNFYRGRQFTVLILLVNQSDKGGISSSVLMRKCKDGQEEMVDCDENMLVLFEGARVLHKVTPASAGDTRIVLSMTLNTEPRIGLFWELARRVKDIAFHGFSVLWD